MGRFVIAIDGMKFGNNKIYNYTEKLENIFTSIGKIISENEAVLVFMSAENKYANIPIILNILNNYDKVRYINGYSRGIINVFTRVEVRENLEKSGYLEPVDILEKSSVMNLMADGYLPLIFAPGAPVVKNLQYYSSIDGHVQANIYSSLLATLIEADTMIIITDMPLKALNPDDDKKVATVKIGYRELSERHSSGYFENTGFEYMIMSIINFISKGGKKSIIIQMDRMDSKVEITN